MGPAAARGNRRHGSLVVLATQEARNAQRSRILAFLCVFRAGRPARKIGHALEQGAATNPTADARRRAIDTYLWSAVRGMYMDYDFVSKTSSNYAYLTKFYTI